MSLMTAGYELSFSTSDDANAHHGATYYTSCPAVAADAQEAGAEVTPSFVFGPRHDDACTDCAAYVPSDLSGLLG
jgi:hypothetical protein